MSRVSSENKNFAIRIDKNVAQITLNEIIEKGLLDKERKVKIRNGFAEIPVKNFLVGYDIVCQDRPEFYRNIPKLQELLEGVLDPEELDLLPRGWHFLGELLLVRIHPALDNYKHSIGRALLSIHPRCKSVLRDFGIEGQYREPVREVLAGSVTTTIHKENGVLFKLDASKIMFSQGNLKERIRMSRLGKDEFVMDMFAGIGYFSIPMAVHSRPRKIIAIELNKLAYNFLKDNIKLNRVEDIVEPVLGDCMQMVPEVQADRAIMGMVQVTDRYLLRGIDALHSGGILHYHQTVPSWHYPQAAIREVVDAAKFLGCQPEIINMNKVKKYAPGIIHAVIDARIQKSV